MELATFCDVRLASRDRGCIRTRSTPSQSGVLEFTKKFNASHTTKPRGRTEEPADFQKAEDRYRDGEGDAPLPPSTPQTNTTIAIDAGFHRHQSHLFGPELLQRPAIPPRDIGPGGRSSDKIETTKLTLQGKFIQPTVLKNVYFAPRVGGSLWAKSFEHQQ
jgi:hypothetical protein